MSLQKKIPVAFVTGSSGTIGSSVVDRLLRENFAVMMFARNEDKLREQRDALFLKYPMTILQYYAGDVKVGVDITGAIRETRKIAGEIDLLVTCHAAPPAIEDSEYIGMNIFRSVIESDLIGTFQVNQQVGRRMLRNGGGCIVNLSSIHSVATYPKRSPYSAAKAGVVGFSRVLGIEWASRGVRVNCISPGQVKGLRTTNANGHQMSDVLKRVPSGKLTEASDIAETVMYLWRTEGITGQNVIVDGGHTSSAWYMNYE